MMATSLPFRERTFVLSGLFLITTLSWVYLWRLARDPLAMCMVNMNPWTPADLSALFAMWAVMMVGMMGPSATPMLLLFAAAQSKSGKQRAALSAGVFAMGYTFVWTAFSAGAAAAQWALHQAALLSPAMAVLSPRIGGAVLIAAGIYQITPWKSACLAHCRSPLSFLMTHWREGEWRAFGIGVHHGAYCLGCCWALMIVLFVVGVMNLVWVAALAAFVLLEKAGPHGTAIARLSGAALIVYGIVTIA